MNFLKYLKDQILLIFLWVVSIALFDLIIFLEPKFKLSTGTFFYADILSFMILFFYLITNYNRKKNWFNSLNILREDSTREVSTNSNQEELELNIILDIIFKLRHELTELNKSKSNQEEFIESWVHDIKVPLTALKLILEKDDINLIKEQSNFEITNINHLVEQILYYSRLNNFANDYLIKQINLKDVVSTSLKNNMILFISKNISVNLSVDNLTVLTDEKWLEFIINQIISNSLKYTNSNGKINIEAQDNNGVITLKITDTGIGIKSEDIIRVFDKGFTGQNGRLSSSKSTGLGLYLAKKMSDKLGQELTIESEYNHGTTVNIVFPTLSYFKQFN
ncbi:sensor histidine kinase [Companilactobacillus sp. DQM5]|uniref:sensor histidine kinase n=1 Tax=Companilactobacillus sp. DQM5 TaxID=3463359 RepID=UPI0040586290